MSGPVPSNLVLLDELDKCAPRTKVRFLGCVDEYIVKTAILRLKHEYIPSNRAKVASVGLEHVLEALKWEDVDVGTWINVIGYVEQRKEKGTFVQAIAVWNAGNVDSIAYADAVIKRKAAG